MHRISFVDRTRTDISDSTCGASARIAASIAEARNVRVGQPHARESEAASKSSTNRRRRSRTPRPDQTFESAVLCEKMEKPLKLAGKTVVVTGVCSGVGAEVARLARCEGARLIGVDLEDPVVMLDAFFRIDQGSPEEIDAALTQFPERVDGLVNAAGVSGTLDRDIVARVNYLGIRHLSHALACPMPEASSIVNFACLHDPEWPKRVDLHKELAATQSFTDGLAWPAANPVPQEPAIAISGASIDWIQLAGGLIFAALMAYAASEYRRRVIAT